MEPRLTLVDFRTGVDGNVSDTQQARPGRMWDVLVVQAEKRVLGWMQLGQVLREA